MSGKKGKIIRILLILITSILIAVFCSAGDNGRDKIFVSILPQKYFVEKIAGDLYDIQVLVGPGQSPATFEPTPLQMKDLGDAEIFFTIGVPFEKSWIDKIQNNFPDLKIVDISKKITRRKVKSYEHLFDDSDKSHSDDHHDHSLSDPHCWLSPGLTAKMAVEIYKTLAVYDTAHSKKFQKNLVKFQTELDSVSNKIKNILSGAETSTFLVFHPAFGYFADEFGLRQIPFEIEGKEPAPAELAEVIEFGKRNKVKTVFVQRQFSVTSAKILAKELEAKIVTIDPLAENYLENLILIAKSFRAGN